MPVAEKPGRVRFVRFAGITSVFSVLENGASLFGGGGPVFSSAPGKMLRNRFLVIYHADTMIFCKKKRKIGYKTKNVVFLHKKGS